MKQHAESLVARLKDPNCWPGFGTVDHLQQLQELAGEAKGRGTTDGYLAAMLTIHQLTEETIKVLIDDAHFYTQLDAAWAVVVEGMQVSEKQAADLQSASLALANFSRRAVDELYPVCGLHAAREGTDINRVWRDFHTATQHSLFLP